MQTIFGRLRFRLEHHLGAARMSDYLDGELEQVLRRRLIHHLSEGHECRELLVSLRQLVATLHGAASADGVEPAPPIAAAVLARLDEPA